MNRLLRTNIQKHLIYLQCFILDLHRGHVSVRLTNQTFLLQEKHVKRLQNKVKNYETEAVGLVRASFSVHRSFEGSEVTD